MKDEWISQYIDNELDLDEKIGFVTAVHHDRGYFADVLGFLDQEKLLRVPTMGESVLPDMPEPKRLSRSGGGRWLIPLAVAATLAAMVLILTLNQKPVPQATAEISYRFVIYHPTASAVDISGSFTQWKRLSLKPTGDTGYWEIVLALPKGAHRFNYVIGGDERIPDPTIPTREQDDFGGINSVLEL